MLRTPGTTLQCIKAKILASGYIQADESPIKVLDSDKKGSTHQGYQWVYHDPTGKLVLFDYRKGRGQHGPKELLQGYQGYLQCDGYTVYDKIGADPAITTAGCLVHARRIFNDALDNDKARSEKALRFISTMYQQERILKETAGKTLKCAKCYGCKKYNLMFRN